MEQWDEFVPRRPGEVARDILLQMHAFQGMTCGCSRCERVVVLDVLEFTVRGLMCERCLREMPSQEWRAMEAERRAVEAGVSR